MMSDREVLEKIKNEGLVSPALFEILYGETEEEQLDTLFSSERIRHVHHLLLFYAMLIHAYTVARVVSGEPGHTIKDLGLPDGLTKQLLDCWNGTLDLGNGNIVFSFLISWIQQSRDPHVFQIKDSLRGNLVSLVSRFSNCYSAYKRSVRIRPDLDPVCFDNDVYCAFLRSMPLLRNSTVTSEAIEFATESGSLSVPCLPFLFHNRNVDILENAPRNQVFVFTSMKEGEKNDWPIICLYPLRNGERRTLRIDATHESAHLVFQAVGVTTVWYPMDDYWCDFAYLNKVIEATASVLLKYVNPKKMDRKNIYQNILELYEGTELYRQLPMLVTNKEILDTKNDIKSFLYDIFINLGVFKSLYGLFYDGGDVEKGIGPKDYADRMFNDFIEHFLANKTITQSKLDRVRKEIDVGIQKHLKNLRRIRKEDTRGYDIRRREIYAEWYAYAVLLISGIKTQVAPFADRERMLSIEDYARMIRNPETKPEDSLRDVLLLLNGIYGPLVEEGEEIRRQAGGFDQAVESFRPTKAFFRKYYSQISRQVDALKNAGLEELFTRFGDIAGRSAENPVIDKLLGRNILCNRVSVEGYRDDILNALRLPSEDRSVSSYNKSEDKVFISYNHADQAVVRLLCGQLEEAGIEVYRDESRFHSNDNWRAVVTQELGSGQYAAFILFVGTHIADNNTILFELERAHAFNVKIITVSLLENSYTPHSFLQHMINTEPNDTEKWLNASDLTSTVRELRSNNYIFRKPGEIKTVIAEIQALISERRQSRKSSGAMDIIGVLEADRNLSPLERAILVFYKFLSTGYEQTEGEYSHPDENERGRSHSINHCIFPLVISVRETMIKRDKIALIGYEIIKSGDGEPKKEKQYILSSRRLETDDYYCLPNYRLTDSKGKWMVEPLLIKRSALIRDT